MISLRQELLIGTTGMKALKASKVLVCGSFGRVDGDPGYEMASMLVKMGCANVTLCSYDAGHEYKDTDNILHMCYEKLTALARHVECSIISHSFAIDSSFGELLSSHDFNAVVLTNATILDIDTIKCVEMACKDKEHKCALVVVDCMKNDFVIHVDVGAAQGHRPPHSKLFLDTIPPSCLIASATLTSFQFQMGRNTLSGTLLISVMEDQAHSLQVGDAISIENLLLVDSESEPASEPASASSETPNSNVNVDISNAIVIEIEDDFSFTCQFVDIDIDAIMDRDLVFQVGHGEIRKKADASTCTWFGTDEDQDEDMDKVRLGWSLDDTKPLFRADFPSVCFSEIHDYRKHVLKVKETADFDGVDGASSCYSSSCVLFACAISAHSLLSVLSGVGKPICGTVCGGLGMNTHTCACLSSGASASEEKGKERREEKEKEKIEGQTEVLLVGAGACGSSLARALMLNLLYDNENGIHVDTLHIIDDEACSKTCLSRCASMKEEHCDRGMNKAVVLANELRSMIDVYKAICTRTHTHSQYKAHSQISQDSLDLDLDAAGHGHGHWESMNSNTNANIEIIAYPEKYGGDGVASDSFWNGLSCVVSAVGCSQTRSLLESKGIYHRVPLIEVGLNGTEGHVEIVQPHISGYLAAQASLKRYPPCIVTSFPTNIEHVIQWSREQFEKLFFHSGSVINSVMDACIYMKGEGEEESPEVDCDCEMKVHSADHIQHAIDTFEELGIGTEPDMDSVEWAVRLFVRWFRDAPLMLLHHFPPDALTAAGDPFWAGKKLPRALFNLNDDDALKFIRSASRLRMQLLRLRLRLDADGDGKEMDESDPDSDQLLRSSITRIMGRIPVFEVAKIPKVKISQSIDVHTHTHMHASENASSSSSSSTSSDAEVEKITKIKEMLRKFGALLLRNSTINEDHDEYNVNLARQSFEETRNVIDFVLSTSILRSRVYSIPIPIIGYSTDSYTCDASDADADVATYMTSIAFDVVPSLITSNTCVGGLGNHEIQKLLSGNPLLTSYFNLHESEFIQAAPRPPEDASMWLREEIDARHLSLSELLAKIKEEKGLSVSILTIGTVIVYSEFMAPKKVKARLNMPLVETLATMDLIPTSTVGDSDASQPLSQSQSIYVKAELLCEDDDGNDVDVPSMRIHIM